MDEEDFVGGWEGGLVLLIKVFHSSILSSLSVEKAPRVEMKRPLFSNISDFLIHNLW